MTRQCLRCRREIKECMGFIMAGDFVAACEGRIPWTAIREMCGYCDIERLCGRIENQLVEHNEQVALLLAV